MIVDLFASYVWPDFVFVWLSFGCMYLVCDVILGKKRAQIC